MEAVNARLIDLQAGTYHNPTTGEVIPILLAIQHGLISASVPDGDASHRDSVPMQFSMDTTSGHWNSTGSLTDSKVTGSMRMGTKDTLTRKVETKTIVDISSLPRHGVSGDPSLPRHGGSGDSSLPRHAMSGDSSLPRHGMSGDSSLPRRGLSGDSSLPRHGVSGNSSLPRPGVSGDSSLPQHGMSGDSSLSRHGVSAEHVTITGSGTSVVTNGIKLEEPMHGMDELDSLIAEMKDSAGYAGDADIEVRVMQRPQVDIRVKQPMTLKEAVDAGFIDKSTGLVTDPFSGQQLTLEDAVKAGIIDGKTSSVINPSVGQLVSMEEALKLGIVDGKSGKVLDPTTRRGTSIDEAVCSGVVVSHKPGVKKQEPLTLDKALSNGMMDMKTGMVTDPLTGQKITIGVAVAMGVIDGKASSVVDPSTGRSVSLDEALELGIVDGKSGKVVNLVTGKSISMSEAAQQRHRLTELNAARSGILDVSTDLMAESATGRQVTVQQAVITSELIDTTRRSTMTEGVVDGINGTVSTTDWHTSSKPGTSRSTTTSAVTDVAAVSCDSSSQLLAVSNDAVHAITTAHCVGLTDDLMLSVLQNETGAGKSTGTDVEEQPMNKSTPVTALDQNHLMEIELEGDDDAEAALQIVELNDLLKDKNHTDTQQPKLTAASSMTLLEAVTSGLADSTSGLFEDPHTGKKMPLREAIELRLIATGKMLVTDTAKDETVSLPESVQRQIVDADFTTFVDTKASRQLSFTDAIREGFIREDDRIPTLSELAADGRYDPTTGTVVDPNTGQRISLLEAIESKLLDRQSVRLLDPATGNDISLAEAFERGILDPDTGILHDTYTGKATNLVDSVNKAVLGITTTCLSEAKPPARQQGPSVADKHMNLDESNISKLTGAADHRETPENIEESSKTYSITDAIRDGIYDPKRNVVIDPVSGQQMSLEEAVEIGLIDISRAMVRDPHTGQKVAFEVLVEMGLIDISTGMVRDSQGRHIPLEDAVLNALMFENPPLTGPLTLLQLIDEGLFKVETSEFFDPISRELVSLREAVVRSLLDPQSIVVHEIGSSEVLGIQDAINVGVIDAESGYVRDNLSREVISLADALDRSIVLGKPLPIVTAIDIGLLNETTAKFLDPSCRKFFSLAAAIENGLIDSDSCFTDPATGRAISVSRAVSCAVLDPESACVTNLHTGDVMTLKEAITAAKLMHSSAGKLMSVDKAISLGLFNQSSNVFIDPHTKEELTLEAAVTAGFLDSNSTISDSATGRRITVAQLLNEMPQKVGKSTLSLQEAVEKGYYNVADGTLVNPRTGTRMTLAEAVHSGVIEGSKNFIRVDGKEVSLQDAIQKGLIDPLSSEVAIPGMPVMSMSDAISCKVVIDDDEDKEHKAASDAVRRKDDGTRKKLNMPLQEVLQMGLFIEDTGKVENPETHELLTVQEAFDSCLIDKDSVKFKHPAVGLLMSFDESVKSDLVDPSTGDVMSPEGESLTLKEAVGEGLVITALTDKGLSLIDVVQQGVYEPVSGRLTHPFSGIEMTVQEGIETGLIDTKKTRVCDANQQEMSTDQAINQKLINTVTGRFEEPDSGEPLTLGEAITKNYLIEQKLTKLSIDEAVDRGLFDVRTGIFVDPVTGKQMKMMEAIKSGLLDPSQTLLTSPDGSRTLTLDEAIAAGMVDVNTGELIDVCTRQRMSFVEATDRGLVLDTYVPPMMSFTEANTKGLFDRRTGNFSHPVTGTRLNFEAAINTGLIDPEKCQLILPGPGELSTLAAAIDEDLIDDKFVKITEPKRKHTALLVDALSDERLVPDQNQHQLESSIQMQDTPPTGVSGTVHGSDAVISEVENEKQQMETVSSGPGIAGPAAAVDESTDSKMTMVSNESAVRHGVLLCAVRGMTLSNLINSNLFDRDTSSLFIPDSHTHITLSDALSRGILDFSHVAVRSLVTGHVFDFHTACKNGLVDLTTGSVYYPATGSWLGLMDAVEQGIVFDRRDGQKTLQELVDQGVFDVTAAMFVHAPSKMMNLQQSLESGLLNANKLLIMLPATREAFTLQYAIDHGLADTQRELITSPLTARQFRLVDLCSAGQMQTPPQLPASSLTLKLEAMQGLLNAETRRVQHPVTGEWLTLAEALDSGIINSADTMVKDCRTGRLMSLDAEIAAQMVDTRTAEMINPLTGNRISLFAALEHGLGLSVQEAISAGLFNGETGRFVNPDTSEELTLSEAIAAGLIDPTSRFMTDADTGLPVSLGDALSRGMVDGITGDVLNTQTGTRLGLTEAVHTGLILGDSTQEKFDKDQAAGVTGGTCVPTLISGDGAVGKKQPVSSRISPASHILQPSTGTDSISHLPKTPEDLSLQQTKDDVSQRHLGRHHSLTFEEAVSAGLTDEYTGLVTHPATGIKMTINEAVRSGVINSEESVITDPVTGKQLSLADALSQGIIDEQSSKKITSEVRSRMGLGTPNKGPLQKKMTIREAVAAHLIEPTTGRVTDPRTGNTLTLQEAVESGVIDGQGTKVRDPESGRMLPLMQALNTDLVDFNSNQVIDSASGTSVFLMMAVDPVVVSEHKHQEQHLNTDERPGDDVMSMKTKITLNDAVNSSLLDNSTGLITDPSSGQQMTLVEAIKGGIIDSEASSIVNPSTGQTVSLSEGLRLGVVDGRSGKVVDRTTGRTIGLDEALSIGENNDKPAILGSEMSALPIAVSMSAGYKDGVSCSKQSPLTLKAALEGDVFDINTGTVCDPKTGVIKSLAEAIRDSLIDPLNTIILDPSSGTACTLQDAVDSGLILPDTGMVCDKSSGRLMTFADAMKSGFLGLKEKSSSGDQPLISLEDAISSGLFDAHTGTFLDTSTNERVPFREALGKIVDVSGIEVRHPKTNRMLSLEEAISDGLIDAETGYFNAATGMPISLQQAMMLGYVMGWMARELTIDVSAAGSDKSLTGQMLSGLLDADTGLVYDSATGKKISMEDAVKRGVIDGNTLCMYDTDSGRMLSVEDCLSKGLINKSTGRITDPSSGQERSIADIVAASRIIDEAVVPSERGDDMTNVKRKLTVDDAVRSGLLDSSTGLITDPSSGQQMTLVDAVKAGIIDSEASSIVNPSTGQMVSLSEGLRLGIVDGKSGKVVDRTTGSTIGLQEAVVPSEHNDYMSDVKKKTTLDNSDISVSGYDVQQSGLTQVSTASIMDSSGYPKTASLETPAAVTATPTKDLSGRSITATASQLEVKPVQNRCC